MMLMDDMLFLDGSEFRLGSIVPNLKFFIVPMAAVTLITFTVMSYAATRQVTTCESMFMILVAIHCEHAFGDGVPLRRCPQAPSLARAHLLTTRKRAVVALRARALSEGDFALCEERQEIRQASFPARTRRCWQKYSSGIFVLSQPATGSLWVATENGGGHDRNQY